MDKQRIEAFSDGVFAVAITLLVLNFKVTGLSASELRSQVLGQWPHLLAYILSFVIVGVYWVAHHTLFHFVARTSRALLWLNNFFLMTVAFLPFPAGLLGEYPSSQNFHRALRQYPDRGKHIIHSDMDICFTGRAAIPRHPNGFSALCCATDVCSCHCVWYCGCNFLRQSSDSAAALRCGPCVFHRSASTGGGPCS
jgi:hypothetical protein